MQTFDNWLKLRNILLDVVTNGITLTQIDNVFFHICNYYDGEPILNTAYFATLKYLLNEIDVNLSFAVYHKNGKLEIDFVKYNTDNIVSIAF